jgi:hypothetical protein
MHAKCLVCRRPFARPPLEWKSSIKQTKPSRYLCSYAHACQDLLQTANRGGKRPVKYSRRHMLFIYRGRACGGVSRVPRLTATHFKFPFDSDRVGTGVYIAPFRYTVGKLKLPLDCCIFSAVCLSKSKMVIDSPVGIMFMSMSISVNIRSSQWFCQCKERSLSNVSPSTLTLCYHARI